MQIRARNEAKRVLRVLRLWCASVDMARRKILAHSVWQRKAKRVRRRDHPAERHKDDTTSFKTDAERKMSQRSSALKKRMAAATNQATTVVRREFANSPILERLLVNWMRGITAKGN